MDLSISVLELLGVLFSGGGLLCSLATTLMSTWRIQTTNLLSTENIEWGLWETCVIREMLECKPYDTLLGLSSDVKLARIFMCTALGVGILGLLLAIPGLRLVNGCSRRQLEDLSCKRALKATAGILCLIAGILVLIPVSYIAHTTVEQFFDESLPELAPRWELGDALFCGWTGGLFYLVAGTLLLISCLQLQKLDSNRPVHVPLVPVKPEPHFVRTKSEYV
uniref:Claudin n=1 Tax=Amphilophus citrinellus TaxID=61819 RepID=A0A3Q0RKY9_AMPCI